VVDVAGVKVGLVGVSPAMASMPGHAGVMAGPPVAAAIAEGKKLRPTVDLLVALAGVPFADAVQLSKESQGVFDLVIESGDHMQAGVMQRNDRNFVLSSGDRGRTLGILEVDLSGAGALVDLSELERDRQRLQSLNAQSEELRGRLRSEKDPAAVRGYQQALASFESQVQQLRDKRLDAATSGQRTLRLRTQALDATIADDPALKAQVDRL
jgi:2',3'-cyclic-nucleotide 2'-phosphodiesterase (5'-nucleotidase family)